MRVWVLIWCTHTGDRSRVKKKSCGGMLQVYLLHVHRAHNAVPPSRLLYRHFVSGMSVANNLVSEAKLL